MRLPIRAAAAGLAFCLLIPAVLPAWAEGKEGAEAAKAVLAEVATAEKDPERTGLSTALDKVPDAHNGLADAGLRKQLQAVLGKALRDAKAGAARATAAAALGRLDDPAGAWKQLSKGLPDAKAKEAGPAELEALKATGLLAPEGAVAPLIKLVQKAKSFDAAREAVTALGSYGKSKKRETILKELLDVTSRHWAASQSAAQNPKGGTGDRPWKELGEALIGALNKLTGQKHPGAAEWLEAYKASKKKLGGLFTSQL